jgi:hypothetical protein
MKDKIIVVSGLTRSGSSLMMQMLNAGGYPISCEPGNEAVSGEHSDQISTLREIALGLADGKAVKSLDPLNFPLPPDRNYMFLWMQRDYSEQAKSITKFMKIFLGVNPNRRQTREIESSLPGETDRSIKYLSKLGVVHRFKFEDCILKNDVVIERLSMIIPNLNTSAMKSVVISRDIKCYDGMLEAELIKRI